MLVCIDCGSAFTQQSVQAHTSCITEMEKFGPKGENAPKGAGGTKNEKQQKETARAGDEGLDFNTGLSTRPPWKCSLCNVNATSQENIKSHAEGKKHRSKVRGQARGAGGAGAAPSGAAQVTVETAAPSPLTHNGIEAAPASVPVDKLGDSVATIGTPAKKGEKEGKEKSGKGKKRKQEGPEQAGEANTEKEDSKKQEDNETPKKKKKDKLEKEKANGAAQANGDHEGDSKVANGHASPEAGMNGHAEAAGQPTPGKREKAKGGKGKATSSAQDSEKAAGKEQQNAEGQGDSVGALASIPWKKLIKKELKQDPSRSLPLRKLKLQAIAAAQALLKEKGFAVEDGKDGAGVKRSQLEEELKTSLTRFKCFSQEGKQVLLKTDS